jgi:hypothetical protein
MIFKFNISPLFSARFTNRRASYTTFTKLVSVYITQSSQYGNFSAKIINTSILVPCSATAIGANLANPWLLNRPWKRRLATHQQRATQVPGTHHREVKKGTHYHEVKKKRNAPS